MLFGLTPEGRRQEAALVAAAFGDAERKDAARLRPLTGHSVVAEQVGGIACPQAEKLVGLPVEAVALSPGDGDADRPTHEQGNLGRGQATDRDPGTAQGTKLPTPMKPDDGAPPDVPAAARNLAPDGRQTRRVRGVAF